MENKVLIEVNGSKYPITTPEEPAYVLGLAEEIDTSLRNLLRGSSMSVTQAMVLLTLNYLDASNKSEQSADRLRREISQYVEESAKANMELSEAQGEIERLSRELEKQKHNK